MSIDDLGEVDRGLRQGEFALRLAPSWSRANKPLAQIAPITVGIDHRHVHGRHVRRVKRARAHLGRIAVVAFGEWVEGQVI
jgi:hypothetical protein